MLLKLSGPIYDYLCKISDYNGIFMLVRNIVM